VIDIGQTVRSGRWAVHRQHDGDPGMVRPVARFPRPV